MTEKDEKLLWQVLAVMYRMLMETWRPLAYNRDEYEACREAEEIFEQLVQKNVDLSEQP